MSFYYAVAKGRKPGIYQTWDECKSQVNKFPGPVFKKFRTSAEAQSFIDSRGGQNLQNQIPLATSAKTTYCRPAPKNAVPLGGRGTHTSSKRVWQGLPDDDENSTVNAKKRKTESSNKTAEHFDMDPDGWVNVWTDGACSSNGNRGAKAGVGVYFGDGSPLNISEPVVGRATNNMAEIQAVTRAAETAVKAGMTKIRVNTDSKFLIDCITKWMPGWKRRGWLTAEKKPVINKQELQEMESALRPLVVQWNHVRGHQGNHGNEQADKLARDGALRYKK